MRSGKRKAALLALGAALLLALFAAPRFAAGPEDDAAGGRGAASVSSDGLPAWEQPGGLPAPEPGAPPEIHLTSEEPEAQAAEAALASFIWALHQQDWSEAASYLAASVPDEARQALRDGEWLRPPPAVSAGSIFYLSRLRLRLETMAGGRATILVLSEQAGEVTGITGVSRVTMIREGPRWRVHLTPAHTGEELAGESAHGANAARGRRLV